MNKYKPGHTFRALFLASVMFAQAGCTKEDMSDCEWVPARLTVLPAVSSGEVGATVIESVTLFVFDDNDKFLGQQPAEVNKIAELDYRDAGPLKVVAIANNRQENETITACAPDGDMSGGAIELREKEVFDLMQIFSNPSDLFHGSVYHPNQGENSAETKEVLISRIVAGMKVTFNKLREHSQAPPASQFTVVATTNYRKVDFHGVPMGEPATYKPPCGFDHEDKFVVSAFNMLSSQAGEDVVLKVYMDGQLIETITEDNDHQPLKAVNDRLLDVYVDYTGDLSVSVSLNGWGRETVWDKEF